MASVERGLMGNHLFTIAMEFPCHTSFELCSSVASTELYWSERILCLVLLNDCYFKKCPKNVESNLKRLIYFSIIEIQEIKIRPKKKKASMIVREAQEK